MCVKKDEGAGARKDLAMLLNEVVMMRRVVVCVSVWLQEGLLGVEGEEGEPACENVRVSD